MAYNVQREKSRKESANHGRLFYACSKGKDDSCGYFEWHDQKEDEDPFEAFSTVYFSNPPSYGYTVKETGETFTSRHENIIATKLTKNTCSTKPTKKTGKTGYANYKLINKHS